MHNKGNSSSPPTGPGPAETAFEPLSTSAPPAITWLPGVLVLAFLCTPGQSSGARAQAQAGSEAAEAGTRVGQVPGDELAAADAAFRAGRHGEAAEMYRALAVSAAASDDAETRWKAQTRLAYALGLLGRHEESDAEFVTATKLAAGDPVREGWTRVRRGALHSRRGSFGAAHAEALRAQQLAEQAQAGDLESASWHLLGEIYSLTGRYGDAISANERNLELRRTTGASESDIADAQSQLAIDYRHVGRHSEAVELYRQALTVHRRNANPEGQARVLYNLANVYVATGDLPAAVASMREAHARVLETETRRGLALVLNGLADVYTRAGNIAAASEHLARALEINREMRQPYGQATNLLAMGWLALEAGDLEAAEERLAGARSLADEHGYRRQQSGGRAALAHVAARRGDGEDALRWADEAVRIADALDDPEAQFEALEARAAALEAGRKESSAAAYLEAIDLLESWRARLVLGDLRMSVAEPRWSVYEGAIRVLLEEARGSEAFEVAERARARLLLEIISDRDASRAAASEQQLLRRDLRERYAEKAAATQPGRAAELDGEITRLQAALSALERAAKTRDAASGAARYPSPASIADVQTGLLGSGRALLAFFWGERDVYGWWITAEEVRAARLGPADALAARIDFLRAAVEQPSGRPPWAAAARAAFEALLAPLSPTLAEEIFVIADGPLAHIPIEVLIPADGAEPLGAAIRITYGPSASVLAGLAEPRKPVSWNRSILIVGNPLAGDNASPAALPQRTDSLSPLPFAAAEARAIFELFRDDGAELLLGNEATLDAWRTLEPHRYRYLHFASHARVSSQQPAQTHLVLAGDHLDLAAIRELELYSELVTLSACDTGSGRRVRGEGIIGLSHAFLSAGARGAVVTLWRIDDAATAEFMQRFYQRLRIGDSPVQALLSVRRERLAAGSHPARWAPFVLVGGL